MGPDYLRLGFFFCVFVSRNAMLRSLVVVFSDSPSASGEVQEFRWKSELLTYDLRSFRWLGFS